MPTLKASSGGKKLHTCITAQGNRSKRTRRSFNAIYTSAVSRFQNMWVRYGAVGFIAAVARTLNVADVHCNLLPQLQPFLKQPVVQVDQEVS